MNGTEKAGTLPAQVAQLQAELETAERPKKGKTTSSYWYWYKTAQNLVNMTKPVVTAGEDTKDIEELAEMVCQNLNKTAPKDDSPVVKDKPQASGDQLASSILATVQSIAHDRSQKRRSQALEAIEPQIQILAGMTSEQFKARSAVDWVTQIRKEIQEAR